MKLTKDELINKVNEKIDNVDLAIELIEDITDSFEIADTSELDKTIELLKSEITELKEKYKTRFLTSEVEPEEEKIDELKEDEIIDIREI